MKRIRRVAVTVLFLFYLVVVMRITVFRSSFMIHSLCQNGKIILTLFEGYIDLIRRGDWFAFTYLFVGNIVWFVPFGMYSAIYGDIENARAHSSLWVSVLPFDRDTAVCVRNWFSELDDLVLNTLGAWIGGVIVTVVHT